MKKKWLKAIYPQGIENNIFVVVNKFSKCRVIINEFDAQYYP
jgi:hypothetical protein